MNQERESVIVKHVNQNQRNDNDNDNLRQFYESCSDSDEYVEDLSTHDVEFVVVQSDDESDSAKAKRSRNVKQKRWRETKVDREHEFETKQWLLEAAKQDVLENKFSSGRACANFYGLSHASLNRHIKNGTSLKHRGAVSKVSQ